MELEEGAPVWEGEGLRNSLVCMLNAATGLNYADVDKKGGIKQKIIRFIKNLYD